MAGKRIYRPAIRAASKGEMGRSSPPIQTTYGIPVPVSSSLKTQQIPIGFVAKQLMLGGTATPSTGFIVSQEGSMPVDRWDEYVRFADWCFWRWPQHDYWKQQGS
jgi:hypothetical protein